MVSVFTQLPGAHLKRKGNGPSPSAVTPLSVLLHNSDLRPPDSHGGPFPTLLCTSPDKKQLGEHVSGDTTLKPRLTMPLNFRSHTSRVPVPSLSLQWPLRPGCRALPQLPGHLPTRTRSAFLLGGTVPLLFSLCSCIYPSKVYQHQLPVPVTTRSPIKIHI